jgi:hypothetical protein
MGGERVVSEVKAEVAKNKDPAKEPISSICHGWTLKTGGLVLLVKCEDGVVRDHLVETKGSW